MKISRGNGVLRVVLLAGAVAELNAETVAYWRFEEKTSGEVPAHATVGGGIPDTILDSSGNGNHMQTWKTAMAPAYTNLVAPPAGAFAGVAGTGSLNTAALDFSGWPQDIYAGNKSINAKPFEAWTVEASFILDHTGRWQVIVAKDGNPLGHQPPLSLKVRANDILEIGMVDASGTVRWLVGSTRLEAGRWYHAAATATTDSLSLWLKPAGVTTFIPQGSIPIQGAFFNDYSAFNQPWIVGRGMWNGGQADWTDGRIDEVRISDAALSVDQFLGSFSPVDGDADGISDSWELVFFRESATESDAAILAKQSSTSDLDGDGYSNRTEFRHGLDPTSSDDLTGKLTREVWYGIDGWQVADLTRNPRYYEAPDLAELIAGATVPTDINDHFGERLRGWITAPVTGDYTFWISGDNQCELLLSASASKFGRQIIASVPDWTAPGQWDKFPAQRSVAVPLVAGQRYFIECLHKEEAIGDSLSVAWTPPGGEREVLPLSVLSPYLADPEDADGDELADVWESANGFCIENGTSDPTQHPLADPDHDGFSNLEESLYGTDPSVRGGVPGSLLLETWHGLSGNEIADLVFSRRFSGAPDLSEFVFSAETPANRGDDYGARMRGYVIAPAAGSYTFYLAGDDSCQLWLSPSDSQFAKQLVATVSGWTDTREWAKYPSQQSQAVSLEAGQKVYIEALQKEGRGGDHLAIGWLTPGASAIEVIPGSALESYAFDARDADGDNMPDDWETLHQLDPTDDDAGGDPDGDAVPNHLEALVGSDPQVKSAIAGGLLQEVWWNVPGVTVEDLTTSPRFLARPDDVSVVTSGQSPGYLGENYGRRLRGYLTAPVTGDYRFWIASDDESHLFLSPGESKFDKKEIGSVIGWLEPNEWDAMPGQKSGIIHLEAGQRYFIEALHKEKIGADHLAIAWQKPGGSREIIPGTVLSTFVPTAEDMDDDDLPDTWETANGLSIQDNGSIIPANGAQGDPDGDGLSNLEEMTAGTRIDLADTDGDGINDGEEIQLLETEALVADVAPFQSVGMIPGSAFAATSGQWIQEDGKARQDCVRGWLEYPVILTAAGVCKLDLVFTPHTDAGVSREYEIVFSVDGNAIQRETVTVAENSSGRAQILTPWLAAGSHSLRVFIDNSYSYRRITVDQLEVLAAAGPDSNANGTPDWVDLRLARNNSFETPLESITSPVCLEGRARWSAMTTVNGSSVQAAPNDRWFANVPLDPAQSTTISAELENGGLSYSRGISWIPVNLFESGDLTIRQGDSLRLTAFHSKGTNSNEHSIVAIEGQSYEVAADEPLVYRFDNPGSFPIEAYKAGNGNGFGRTITIHVVAAPTLESPVCVVGYYREVDIPALPGGVTLQMDSRVEVREITTFPDGSARNVLRLTTLDDRPAVLRLGGITGPVLGTAPVRGMRVRAGSETSMTFAGTTPSGLNRLVSPIVVNGPWPDVTIEVDIFIGGVTFDDGTVWKMIDPATACDAFGIIPIEFLKLGTDGSACHRIGVWQAGRRIAWRQ